MSYDPNNIFAKIVRGEIPSHKVYEDEHSFAFLDIMPAAEGHTLVVPKEGIENIFEVSPEGLAVLIQATQKVARAVKKAVNAPGIVITQFNGAPAGQTVFHIHFHIIPRAEGQPLQLHGRAHEKPEKLAAVAEKVRAAIASN